MTRTRRWRRSAWVMGAWMLTLHVATARRAAAQRHAEPLLGLRFGPPIRAGVAFAVTYGGESAVAQFAGPIAMGEVGVGGARVSAGYLFAQPFMSGVEVLGSVIRTWGAPAQVDPNRTLAGGEVRVVYFAVNVGIGAYRPVAGFEGNRRARYFLNVGLGV